MPPSNARHVAIGNVIEPVLAHLLAYIGCITNRCFTMDEVNEIDTLVNNAILPAQKLYVQPAMVNELLAAMGQPGRKIEAIKAYRAFDW